MISSDNFQIHLNQIIMSENNHLITLSEAKELTHKFQQDPRFQGMTVASKISANAYSELLNQPGCAGIRTYFAIKEDAITIVVIGVDSNGVDQIDGIILDQAEGCPSTCDTGSKLML